MTKILLLSMLLVAVPAGAPLASAAEVKDELEYLRREVYHLRQEIAELKAMLKQVLAAQGARVPPTPVPKTVTVPVDGFPSLGRADAPLTLVEFSSYQCGICKQHHGSVLPKLKAEYVDTGKVRYVFRDLPLRSEPNAPAAASAAHCAGAQGRYWEMHDALFKQQHDLSVEALKSQAQALGLDASKFSACLEGGTFAATVERGVADAQAAGFRGTPSFVVGPTAANGIAITGVRVIGAQSFAVFKQVIEQELERLSSK